MDERVRALEAAVHDLRQPLHVIAMVLGAVERNEGAKYAALLERAKRAVETLDHSFEQCIDALRLSSGAWTPAVEAFELRPFAKRLVAEYAALASQAGIRLRFSVPALKVRCDPDMLGRLLGDLILNAVAFTERGGILVGARRREGAVLIQVFDTGRASARQELGLGFILAERMAHALGHELAVCSLPGKGSCVAVRIAAA